MQIHYCFKKNYTGVSKSVLRKLILLLLAYWGSTVASLLTINPPFFPTYLSITLSLLFRGRGKTHPGKKKRTLSPNTENSRSLPCNPILSRVHSRHTPSKKFAALHTLLMLRQQAQLGKKNSTGAAKLMRGKNGHYWGVQVWFHKHPYTTSKLTLEEEKPGS